MDSGTPTPCGLGSHGHLFRTSLGAQCLPLSPTILQYPELKCCLCLYIAAKELHSAYKDEVLVRQRGSLRPPHPGTQEKGPPAGYTAQSRLPQGPLCPQRPHHPPKPHTAAWICRTCLPFCSCGFKSRTCELGAGVWDLFLDTTPSPCGS